MRWLCVLLPRLTLELFARGRPGTTPAAGEPPDGSVRPAVVVQEHRVLYGNDAARARGVRPGTGRASARAVCPDLWCIERDAEALRIEREALERLAGWAYGLTAAVSPEAPDALLLEIEGSLRLFGDQRRLETRIRDDLEAMDLTAVLGVGHTPAAALALARAGTLLPPCPLPELRARTLAALAHAPLACARLDARQRERLEGLGVRTVGALLDLPRPAVARRFGPALVLYLDRLTGRVPEPRRTVTPAPTFRTTVHFLEDVAHGTGLLFPMRRQLAELEAWLRSRQLATDALVWRFRHRNHEPVRCLVRTARPETRAPAFLELTRLRLERAELPPAVATLELVVRRLVPASRVLGDGALPLESRRPGVPDEDPTALLGRLGARLGETSCHGLTRVGDHRPEHAVRAVPVSAGHRFAAAGPAPADRPPPVRPTWLLARPRPVRKGRDGTLFWQGPLVLLQGPERIDAAWWEDRAGRDYYVAGPAPGGPSGPSTGDAGSGDRAGDAAGPARLRDTVGDAGTPRIPPRYWIYRDLGTGEWFLHGLFG